jgi:3D (Asp-Asp-Asp) domain-containing protein
MQLLACGERKKPIGVVTTTKYCQGKITASSRIVKPGYIALSRDIEKKYRLKFGDLIYVEGEKEPYVFMDRMPAEWKRHVDLYTRNCKSAKEYGVKKRMIWFVRKR